MSTVFCEKNQKRQKIVFADDTSPYLPAILNRWNSGWMITYYIENPQTHTLERKRQRVDYIRKRFKNDKGAILYITKMLNGINEKLEKTKNPNGIEKILTENERDFNTAESVPGNDWVKRIEQISDTINTINEKITTANAVVKLVDERTGNDEKINKNPNLFTPLVETSEKYLQDAQRNNLSKDTIRSYHYFVQVFTDWMISRKPDIKTGEITKNNVVDFMDYIYNERKGRREEKMSNRTYNNYIKNGSAYFTWLKDRCYCQENLFQIKLKKVEKKQRVLIPPEYRDIIFRYLIEKRPIYLVILKLIYNSLIRPKEVRNILIEDICLEKKYIRIKEGKNGKPRNVPMTPDIYEDFKAMELDKYDRFCYVFGNGFNPSPVKLSDSYMYKFWAKVRAALNLPKEMVQYSFRDSGMSEMIKSGIDQLSVKQLADHHSLAMTDIYTNHVDPNLGNIIYNNAPKFSSQVQR